ncbi:tetratricopeptide repeat protein [Mesoterricola silvestris]|nr:tetratricopeptide repeat protein [Mesoterricola silvestris]
MLCLGFIAAQAQQTEPSVEARKAALPALKGQERMAALLDLANGIESASPQEALVYAQEGLSLAVAQGDRNREAAFLTSTAYCSGQSGDYPKAIEYGRRALALSTQLGDKDRMAKAHNALAITYTFVGSYSQALDEAIESLRLREELGLEKAVTQSLNLIGVVYHNSGQYDKALDYYGQILKRIDQHPDNKRLILTRLNIGFAQFKMGRLEEALANHQAAFALSRETRDDSYLAYNYMNLGMTYSELRKFDLARENLRLARLQYAKFNHRHGLVQVLNASARMHLLSGSYRQGIPIAREAAALASVINARDERKRSFELIAELHEKLGETAEAYRAFKQAMEIKDSIYTIQESNKIAESTMKIVTIRKDNEIEALKKERVIASLQLERNRYFLAALVLGLGTLGTAIVVMAVHSRNVRRNREALRRSNDALARINLELQERMNEIKTLSGLLPICAQCKKIRNDQGYWTQLESYVSEHTSATFSHGICPNCAEDLYPEAMDRMRKRTGSTP